MILNDAHAIELLTALTRETIEAAVRHQPPPGELQIREACHQHPILCEPAGAFVTVYVGGELRGCLGEIVPHDGMLQVALRCAARSPVADYRFDPILPRELEQLGFRISLLSRPEQVEQAEEIEVGQHGVMVRHGSRVGLLLPEVATEHGWNREALLQALWRKAGLRRELPLEAVQLSRFTTQLIESGMPAAQHG